MKNRIFKPAFVIFILLSISACKSAAINPIESPSEGVTTPVTQLPGIIRIEDANEN